MAHELLLLGGLHHHGYLRDEIGRLLPHFGRLIVKTPQDGAAYLWQVGFHSLAQRVYHCTEAVQHDRVVRGLLLKRVQYAVDELLLETVVHVRRRQVGHYFLDSFHHHLAVLFRLVLEVVHDAVYDLGGAYFVGDLDRGVHELSEVAAVQRHTLVPEVFEKRRQHFVFDVLRLHTVCATALLYL